MTFSLLDRVVPVSTLRGERGEDVHCWRGGAASTLGCINVFDPIRQKKRAGRKVHSSKETLYDGDYANHQLH